MSESASEDLRRGKMSGLYITSSSSSASGVPVASISDLKYSLLQVGRILSSA